LLLQVRKAVQGLRERSTAGGHLIEKEEKA